MFDGVIARIQALPNLVIEYAPAVAMALAIFLIGRVVVRRLSQATVKVTDRIPTIDTTLAKFFGSLVLFAGMFAVIIAALSALHINLAFLATIVASLMIALGFALQETLGDVASGLMLAVFGPYGQGDDVEIGGERGVIVDVGLFVTRLKTRDNIEIVVGNGRALGNTIKNYYAYGDRRLDMDFGVSYDANIGDAITAITSVADGDDRIRTEPAPWAKVTALGDSSVSIQLRVWCDADQYRHIQMDLSQRVKAALDKAGIEIPYEHGMIIKKEAK